MGIEYEPHNSAWSPPPPLIWFKQAEFSHSGCRHSHLLLLNWRVFWSTRRGHKNSTTWSTAYSWMICGSIYRCDTTPTNNLTAGCTHTSRPRKKSGGVYTTHFISAVKTVKIVLGNLKSMFRNDKNPQCCIVWRVLVCTVVSVFRFVSKDPNHPEVARWAFTEFLIWTPAMSHDEALQCTVSQMFCFAYGSHKSIITSATCQLSTISIWTWLPNTPHPPSSHALGIWQMRALMLMLIHSWPMQARSLSLFNSNSQNSGESEQPALWWKPRFARFLPFFGNGSFSFVPPFRFEV